MDAQGIGIAMGMRQLAHGLKVGHFHRRDDATPDTLGAGLLTRWRAVCVKFRRVEVAVGVDPKHGARIIEPTHGGPRPPQR